MFTVELYARIRRAVMIEGLSRREAAQRFGVHRNTIAKMLLYAVPPGYRRRERPVSKKLQAHSLWIDGVLEGDKSVHKKQRHTAHRIFERLRDERGFSGCYTIVREYVALVTLRSREMFIPLSHVAGQAQVDFGEADGYIGGKKIRFHYFCMDPVLQRGRLCRIRMAALSKPIQLRRLKPSVMAMWRHLPILAACPNRYFTITPSLP